MLTKTLEDKELSVKNSSNYQSEIIYPLHVGNKISKVHSFYISNINSLRLTTGQN